MLWRLLSIILILKGDSAVTRWCF